MTINAQVALQAALNELAEMRHELQPFVYETGPARGMVRRIERVQALVDAVREQLADEARERAEECTQ